MLPDILQLSLLYVVDHAYNWQQLGPDDRYYPREFQDEIPPAYLGQYPMKYGDVSVEGHYFKIIGLNGEIIVLNNTWNPDEIDPKDPLHPIFEVWRVNPGTGHFIYSDYWDYGTTYIEKVYLDHGRRNELIDNFTIVRKGKKAVFYTSCLILNVRFYIYMYWLSDDECVAIKSDEKEQERLKTTMIEYFKKDKGIYSTYMSDWDEDEMMKVRSLYPIEPEETEQHPQILWFCVNDLY